MGECHKLDFAESEQALDGTHYWKKPSEDFLT
jgi:hypothetical protein